MMRHKLHHGEDNKTYVRKRRKASEKAIEGRRDTKGNRITQGGDTREKEQQERATGEREQGSGGKRNSPLPKGNGLLIYIRCKPYLFLTY